MDRRPNRTGTIFKRKDGYYQGTVYIGRDPETGKEKKKTFYGKSRPEVSEKLQKFIAKMKLGLWVEGGNVTLGDWLDAWLEQYAKPSIRPTTYDNYEMVIRLHIKPSLGHIKLEKLQPGDIQSFYNTKLEKGNIRTKKGLSPRTIRIAHVILHEALEQALKEERINRNPVDFCSPPKVEKREVSYLTPEEEKKFLQALEGEPLAAAFILLLGTGIRRGELLGLRWQDIITTPDGTFLNIRQQLVKAKIDGKQRLIFQPPKSDKGRRTIPLLDWGIEALKKHREKQNEQKIKCGKKYEDHDLVFATATGRPINPRNFHRTFKRILAKAGIPDIRLHALRHTFATRLGEANIHPKVMQELLGHSSVSLTLGTYTHVLPKLKQEAVVTLDNLRKQEDQKDS